MKPADESCPACGAAPFLPGRKCSHCGLTLFSSDGHSFDYEKSYGKEADYNAKPPEQILTHYRRASNTAWALQRLDRIRQGHPQASLLEIGASQGAFLVLARDLGFQIRGFELSPTSVRYGRERLGLGNSLEESSWRTRRNDEPAVDVVCAFEVLEHAANPHEFLSTLHSWFRPGGHLLLSVPNGRRFSVRLRRREPQDFPPHHFSYWTRQALTSFVQRRGFLVLEASTSPLTHSDIAGAITPSLARRRAADLGSFRPVGSEPGAGGLPRTLRAFYPALAAIARTGAGVLDFIPELGSRLMLHGTAEDPHHHTSPE